MFENRSLRIQMVKDHNTSVNNQSIDHTEVVKSITNGIIKIFVVYISADTIRQIIVKKLS